MTFSIGDKARVTEDGVREGGNSLKVGQEVTISGVETIGIGSDPLYRFEEYANGLFTTEAVEPITPEAEKRQYVDMVHFDALTKIRDAFLTLNATISNTPSGWLEVLDMTVVDEAGSPFARVSYVDGDVLVEPLFSLVRDFEDR